MKTDCENCGEAIEKKEICYYKRRIVCGRCFYVLKCDDRYKEYKKQEKMKMCA